MLPAPATYRGPLLGALLLLAVSPQALASGDLFQFTTDPSKDGFSFDLLLSGRQDVGLVQVTWTGLKPHWGPEQPYYIEFDRKAQRFYVRPKLKGRLPFWELDVVGRRGVLLFNGRRMTGTADWNPDQDG